MGKVLLVKFSRYPHYMDFLGIIFAVQGQGALYVTFRAKDSWEKLSCSSKKTAKTAKV